MTDVEHSTSVGLFLHVLMSFILPVIEPGNPIWFRT